MQSLFRKSPTPLSDREIADWLRELRGKPYVAGSGFEVTSVFRARLGDDDSYYFAGVNVENPHHRLSTHGEEGSISAMVTALGPQAEIVEGWIMGAPKGLEQGDTSPLADNCASCCGKCRQQVAGLAAPEVKMHSISLNGTHTEVSVGEFLPDAFTFRQFAPEALTEKPAGRTHPLGEEEVMNRLVRQDNLSESEIKDWLNSLDSLDTASKRSQAVIVKLANGAYAAGVQVEDAAYVSIDPAQAAIAIANAAFGEQKVLEVWTQGKGRDEAALPDDAFTPLNGSAVQVLAQFAAKDIPVHMVNGKGEHKSTRLSQAAQYFPTFSHSTADIGAERFIR